MSALSNLLSQVVILTGSVLGPCDGRLVSPPGYAIQLEVAGFYTTDTQAIVVCGPYHRPTVLHELGHHVYFTMMSEKEQGHFRKLHEASPRMAAYISTYAKTSDKEDFAETFRFVASLNALPKKSLFPNLVFENGILKEKVRFTKFILNKYGRK